MISGHGDDRHRFSKNIRADFSSNVWFGGTSPELIARLQQKMHLIANYPEPDAADLCRQIAEYHKVSQEQVLAFNGSIEAFYNIALAFRNAVSVLCYPAFAEYEDASRMHQHRLRFFRNDEWDAALKCHPDLCWIGNPNNPDGHISSFSQIEQALNFASETIFVVDEAYAAFIPDFQSVIGLTKTYRNLMVVRSLTKCCAIPGLRLGYVVASAAIAAHLRKFQQPWSVNVLAQEAGKFLLSHLTEHPIDAAATQKLSLELQQSIGQLDGFRVIPSETPYFLIEMQSGTAAELKEFLIQEHGILIRDASNFRGLNERFFRVCTQDENDNLLLIEGLKNYSK